MMPIDARNLENNTFIEGDICIIGAGAAGITIAREFVNTPYKVILLESGGFTLDEKTQSLYEGKNIGLPYYGLNECRLRFFGGTTNHWGGMCAPLDPIDFEQRDWVPYSGWPINRQDLEPYYVRAQAVCQLGPYRYDLEFWKQQDPDLKELPFDPQKITYKIFQFSPPTRFGKVYRETLLNAKNLVLWTNANVTDIATTPNGKKVSQLRVQCLNGKEHRVQSRYYILACGAIENARLLLASNQTESAGLGNRHDLVGRFFMEHIHVASARLLVPSNFPWKQYVRYTNSAPNVHLRLNEKIQQERKLLNCTYDLYATDYFKVVDIPNSRSSEVLKEEIKLYLETLQKLRHEFEDNQIANLLPGKTRELILFCGLEQIPNPDSRVSLDEEKDILGLPKLKLKWRLSELARQTIKEANYVMALELGRSGVGRLQFLNWLTQEEDSWPLFPQVIRGGYHHMGTTRMSEHPKTGVVNPDCRVHGINNLYIAGSSVYPTSGTANPTLTLVALGIRMADRLKEILSSS